MARTMEIQYLHVHAAAVAPSHNVAVRTCMLHAGNVMTRAVVHLQMSDKLLESMIGGYWCTIIIPAGLST